MSLVDQMRDIRNLLNPDADVINIFDLEARLKENGLITNLKLININFFFYIFFFFLQAMYFII